MEDDNNMSLELDYSPIISDMTLKPSNSLPKNTYFSHYPVEANFSKESPLSKAEFNQQTSPSTKLLPPISLKALLSYNQKMEQHCNESHQSAGDEPASSHDDTSDIWELEDEVVDAYDLGNNDSDDDESNLAGQQVGQPGNHNPPPNLLPKYLKNRLSRENANREHLPEDPPKDVIVHMMMMQLQEKHGLSFAAVDDIYNWANKACKIHPDIFRGPPPSRERMIMEYRNQLGMDDGFEFKEEVINWLPDNKPVVQHVRPFIDCVYELLTNKVVLGPNSCNINLPHESDPFKNKPSMPPKEVSELHYGSWWRKTMKMKRKGCGKESRRITCPSILETDETHTDTNGRLTVTTVNIKLGLYNNNTRKKEEASTTWFYLPNDESEAAHHEQKTETFHKIQNLHSALRNGMTDLKYLMDNDIGFEWDLFYGGKSHTVELVFFHSFHHI
ncbi:unnamed protein product [Cylindrotheca closterium]|uniref:Uncharacterized protein n=1 Tax=Cylindrotheca closterium TaxID=2856 RepID=A0AAD2CU12_9STRA|nr:unnamed protein product [Cylindrotheca closterium]